MVEKKYYTVAETARMFALSPWQVRQRCKVDGQKFAIKHSGRFLIDAKKFEQWLKIGG